MKFPRFSATNLDQSQHRPNKLSLALIATTLIASSQLLAMISASANPVPTPTEPNPVIPTRTILNGTFQQPTVSGYGIGVQKGYNNTGLPIIWQTTEKGDQYHNTYVDQLEVWAQIEGGVSPKENADGNQFVELNSDTNASIYQDICVLGGETVSWSLKHAVRQDPGNIGSQDYVNKMRVSVTNPATWLDSKTPPSVKLYESPDLTTKSSEGWLTKTGTWTNPTTNNVPALRFAFEAIQGSPLWGTEDKSVGNFIDDVSLSFSPLIDFLPTGNTANIADNVNLAVMKEGNPNTGNPPYYYLSLRINGKLNSSSSVKINLTGLNARRQFTLGSLLKGNAAAPAGLSATKSGNEITLNIPAGSYDANVVSNYIHIPIDFSDRIKVIDDNLTFTLSNPTGGGSGSTLAIGSTSCGIAPRTTVNIQLKDDDYTRRL
jgi:hypothetical protein